MKSNVSYKEIFDISFPMMLGSLSSALAAMADTMFMGSIGHAQMDATGFCGLFLFIISMIGWAFSKGIQILIAQFDGANKTGQIGTYFDTSLIILGTFGFLSFLVFKFFSAPILSLFISDPIVLQYCIEFSDMRSWSFLFVNLSYLMASFYTGLGKTKILILSTALTSLSNIGLNYLLALGNWGFPRLEVTGSALATNISDFLCLLVFVGSFWWNKHYISTYQLFKFKSITGAVASKITNISSPLIIQHFVSLGSWLVFFSWIESMGSKSLAASMIVKSIYMVISIPGFSLSSATNTIVGNLVGQKAIHQILPTIKKIILINFAIITIILIITFLLKDYWLLSFTQDREILDLSQQPLILVIMAMFIFPFGNTFFQGVVSLGDTKKSLIIESLTLLVYMGYAYTVIKVLKLNLAWAWSTEFFYWIFLFLFSILYLRFSSWKKDLSMTE